MDMQNSLEYKKRVKNLGATNVRDPRERINLNADAYAMHFRIGKAHSQFFPRPRAAHPRRVIGEFLREIRSFVRSIYRSIDTAVAASAASRSAQEPWNSANSCGTVWRTLRVHFTHRSFL